MSRVWMCVTFSRFIALSSSQISQPPPDAIALSRGRCLSQRPVSQLRSLEKNKVTVDLNGPNIIVVTRKMAQLKAPAQSDSI